MSQVFIDNIQKHIHLNEDEIKVVLSVMKPKNLRRNSSS